jgi:hypothetical protein
MVFYLHQAVDSLLLIKHLVQLGFVESAAVFDVLDLALKYKLNFNFSKKKE